MLSPTWHTNPVRSVRTHATNVQCWSRSAAPEASIVARTRSMPAATFCSIRASSCGSAAMAWPMPSIQDAITWQVVREPSSACDAVPAPSEMTPATIRPSGLARISTQSWFGTPVSTCAFPRTLARVSCHGVVPGGGGFASTRPQLKTAHGSVAGRTTESPDWDRLTLDRLAESHWKYSRK